MPNTKRGLSVDINTLEKLQNSEEFQRYLEILQEWIDAGHRSLGIALATPEDIRDHNVSLGMVRGLEKARDLVEYHLKELIMEMKEKTMPMDTMNGEAFS